MDRHERKGRAASIAAFVLEGCITSGLADDALKSECSPEDIEAIKEELHEIATDLTNTARYHKAMGAALNVKPGPKKRGGA